MDVAPTRRDDAGGHAAAQAERVADRDHPVADARFVRVSERHGRQRLVRFDAQQRDVAGFVASDQGRFQHGVVVQRHRDLIRPVDHMVIRYHQPARVDDEARPQALRLAFGGLFAASALALALAIAVHEVLKELLERRSRREHRHFRAGFAPPVVRLDGLGGGDVHHRRQQFFGQIGESVRRRTCQSRCGRQADHRRQHDGSGGTKQDGTDEDGMGQTHGAGFLANGPDMGVGASVGNGANSRP